MPTYPGLHKRSKKEKRYTLLADERRREILSLLRKEGRVAVHDLIERFAVSAVTLRSDLMQLAERGLLIRSHGGGILPEATGEDFPLSVKESLHNAEKERIGRAAAALLRPGQTLILDSGTTSAAVARAITKLNLRPLTVITHALNVAQELSGSASISVIMLGGLLRHVSGSFVGPQAERALRELHADHLFLGVDGLDEHFRLSTPDLLEAQLNAVMLEVADESTIVADASKLGRRSLSIIAPVERATRLITDKRASAETVHALRGRGLKVLTV